MSRRAILALSAALTAFVLILAGAAGSYGLRSSAASAAKAPDAVPAEVVQAREAEYRRLLDEANARLRTQQAAVAAPVAPDPAAREGRHERRHAHREDDDG
ncbi:MAG TPA: hypothetical protein VF316_16015 [Polyangiaceae bacterium]